MQLVCTVRILGEHGAGPEQDCQDQILFQVLSVRPSIKPNQGPPEQYSTHPHSGQQPQEPSHQPQEACQEQLEPHERSIEPH